MDYVVRQAKAARRRLTAERFFRFLPWTMLAALLVAAVGILLPKVVHIDASPNVWLAVWLGSTTGVALITAICMTFIGRPSLGDAAAEVDRRFALRERLSSAMAMPDEDKQTSLGQALAADAQRKAETIDVRDQFSFGIGRSILLPVLPAVLAAALCYLPNKEADVPEESKLAQLDMKQVKNSTEKLLTKIKKQREKAEKEGLNAAVDMFKKLEGELAKMRKDAKMDTKQALAKLNDIKDQIADRKKEIGDSEQLRKNLKNLTKLEAGPVDDLADAMKDGDFSKAEDALEKLLDKMQSGEMSESDMKQMQKQLDQLQKAMSDASEKHEAAKDALREQIEQAKAAGDQQKAAQLERKLEKMQAADASMAQMQQMADMLAQASQSMQEGDMQSASEAFEQMAQQMAEMNESDAQLQDLDELMQELADSKSDMMQGMGQGMMGQGQGEGEGDGLGEGAGRGDRPEEEDDVDFYDSRQRDKMRLGETVMGGKVGGANKKGATQYEVQQAVLSSMSEEPEALNDVPLPRTQRDHTRSYFDSIRED